MAEPQFTEAESLWGVQAQPRIRSIAAPVEELPDEEELLNRLGALSELLGASRCAAAYQLFDADDLPEAWEGELADVRALLRRLLRYAGEDDESFPVRLVDGRLAAPTDFAAHLSGELEYAGLGEAATDPATFVVHELGDLRAMFGPACVALAGALVHRARVRSAALGYRDGEARAAAGVELPPPLDGFLASFALGWGIPVTNACLDPRSVGTQMGEFAATAWVSASVNYPPELAARLLAVVYRAGERDDAFVDERRAALNPSQRELFDAASAELEGEGDELRARLRWGDPTTWPPRSGRALSPLVFDAHDAELEAMESTYRRRLRLPNLGQSVFRTRPARSWRRALLSAFAAGIFGSFALATLHIGAPLYGLLVGGMIGALVGAGRRPSHCSAPRCGARLGPETLECPACGGQIVGEIARATQHLDALEAYEGPDADDDTSS